MRARAVTRVPAALFAAAVAVAVSWAALPVVAMLHAGGASGESGGVRVAVWSIMTLLAGIGAHGQATRTPHWPHQQGGGAVVGALFGGAVGAATTFGLIAAGGLWFGVSSRHWALLALLSLAALGLAGLASAWLGEMGSRLTAAADRGPEDGRTPGKARRGPLRLAGVCAVLVGGPALVAAVGGSALALSGRIDAKDWFDGAPGFLLLLAVFAFVETFLYRRRADLVAGHGAEHVGGLVGVGLGPIVLLLSLFAGGALLWEHSPVPRGGVVVILVLGFWLGLALAHMASELAAGLGEAAGARLDRAVAESPGPAGDPPPEDGHLLVLDDVAFDVAGVHRGNLLAQWLPGENLEEFLQRLPPNVLLQDESQREAEMARRLVEAFRERRLCAEAVRERVEGWMQTYVPEWLPAAFASYCLECLRDGVGRTIGGWYPGPRCGVGWLASVHRGEFLEVAPRLAEDGRWTANTGQRLDRLFDKDPSVAIAVVLDVFLSEHSDGSYYSAVALSLFPNPERYSRVPEADRELFIHGQLAPDLAEELGLDVVS